MLIRQPKKAGYGPQSPKEYTSHSPLNVGILTRRRCHKCNWDWACCYFL